MQDAHDDRSLAGPLIPLGGPVDLAAVLADPAQTAGAGVALSDRVGGDQAERAARPHQIEGPPEEVRDKVRVAVALFVPSLEPVGIAANVAGRDGVLPRERWIPDERVEARVLPVEHLGELDLPVKGREGWVGVTLLLQPAQVADGFVSW